MFPWAPWECDIKRKCCILCLLVYMSCLSGCCTYPGIDDNGLSLVAYLGIEWTWSIPSTFPLGSQRRFEWTGSCCLCWEQLITAAAVVFPGQPLLQAFHHMDQSEDQKYLCPEEHVWVQTHQGLSLQSTPSHPHTLTPALVLLHSLTSYTPPHTP